MMHSSSTIFAVCGNNSLTQAPDCPCCANANCESTTGKRVCVDVMPVIQSLLPLDEVIQLPNVFDALDIVLLSVDAGTGEALRDGNGGLIKYNFGNTNWKSTCSRRQPSLGTKRPRKLAISLICSPLRSLRKTQGVNR